MFLLQYVPCHLYGAGAQDIDGHALRHNAIRNRQPMPKHLPVESVVVVLRKQPKVDCVKPKHNNIANDQPRY
jgi:hypothetical protein